MTPRWFKRGLYLTFVWTGGKTGLASSTPGWKKRLSIGFSGGWSLSPRSVVQPGVQLVYRYDLRVARYFLGTSANSGERKFRNLNKKFRYFSYLFIQIKPVWYFMKYKYCQGKYKLKLWRKAEKWNTKGFLLFISYTVHCVQPYDTSFVLLLTGPVLYC